MGSEDKCAERRRKKRIIALRAREIRKREFAAMERQVTTLEISNQALEVRIQELDNLINILRNYLIQKISKPS